MRKGFNTHWQAKRWAREVHAARLAVTEGRLAEAADHLLAAQGVSDDVEGQLTLFDIDPRTGWVTSVE